jgi:4-amino-4-deoxy-L-arabinose transferase-like glycosyltransferase
VLTFLCYWLAFSRGGRWLIAGGAAAGLGVLAKGPVAVVVPVTALFLFLAWSRRLGLLGGRRFLWATLACTLVCAPWYAWVAAETKAEFLRGFFLKHNVDRFLRPMEGHGGTPPGTSPLLAPLLSALYYPLVLITGLAPWSAFLGLAAWYGLGRRARVDGAAAEPAYRFLWCWVAAYFVFFSLAGTKLPNYVLPLYPPAALLLGRFLERWRRGAVEPGDRLLHVGLFCFALVGVLAALGLLIAGGVLVLPWGKVRPLPGLGAWAPAGALPVAGAVAAWWLARRRRRGPALAALASAAVVFLAVLAGWGVMAVDDGKAPRPLVGAMAPGQNEREVRIACYRYFQPSLVFYSRRNVGQLDNEEDALEQLRYPVEVYLLLPAPEWERLRARVRTPCRVLGRHRDLLRDCDVVLVTNR